MRRDLLITALLFAAIGFAGGYFYSEQRVGHSLRPAVEPAVAAGNSAQSMEGLPQGHPPLDMAQRWRELQEKAEANPNDSQAALELANLLYDIQRWDAAAPWYERVLKLQPRNTDARTDLGTCYFNLSQFDQALAAYNQALKDEPDKAQALYGLVLTRLHGKQDRAGAREAFDRLRRTHPNFEGVASLEKVFAQEAKP